MDCIYRFRPYNDNTRRELSDGYLWFSKPSAFKDVDDSNVRLMIESNAILQKAFSLALNAQGLEELKRLMAHIGICCFTKDIPTIKNRTYFPHGKTSICVEYDKEKISRHFLSLGMPNCFKEVVYSNSPVKVEHDGAYHILTKKDDEGECYESILGMRYDTNRFMDKLLFFLLTRIKEKYKRQKELRIIWGGFRIVENEALGYSVNIPKDCIENIYVYPDSPSEFTKAVKELGYDIKTIVE